LWSRFPDTNADAAEIDRSMRMIEQIAGDGLYERKDDEIVPMEKNKSSLLMTLNF
jgi:hypothetical protein